MIESGTVTLVCEVCFIRKRDIPLDDERGREQLLGFIDRGQICRRCSKPLPAFDANSTITGTQHTSVKASHAAYPRSGSQKEAVLLAINSCPSTDEELAQALNLDLNSIRPRRGELADGGWVENSGFTRKTAQHNDAIVWQITPIAITQLAARQPGI